MNDNIIIERILAQYPDAVIDVEGKDCNFEVFVISSVFEGQNTLQRQRPILALFNEELKSGKLHALTIKAKTSRELQSNAGLVQLQG